MISRCDGTVPTVTDVCCSRRMSLMGVGCEDGDGVCSAGADCKSGVCARACIFDSAKMCCG